MGVRMSNELKCKAWSATMSLLFDRGMWTKFNRNSDSLTAAERADAAKEFEQVTRERKILERDYRALCQGKSDQEISAEPKIVSKK